MKSIVVVSKQKEIFENIESSFAEDYEVAWAPNRNAALNLLRGKRYDFVFTDVKLLRGSGPGAGYKTAMQQFRNLYPTIEIVVISPQEMIREAVKAVKAGADNYLTYPVNPEEIRYITETTSELTLMQSELEHLREKAWESELLNIARTKNPLMQQVFDKIRSVSPTKSTVLLIGETGTGKGLLAKLIHRQSNRKDESFIQVHCGAITDTLLESELFGHEKGAFTGAVRRKLGKFEIAKGGSIFLDEIGTITPSAQIKLLQIIQDGIFQRVGGEETIQADARIIAASNMDLKQMCEDGAFRRDLYFRLNVFPIEVPPLRSRKEDIPALIDTFLDKLNRLYEKEIRTVDPAAMEALMGYSWPGNIRELENLMERAYILESSSILSPASFPGEIFPYETSADLAQAYAERTLAEARHMAVDQLEIAYLKKKLTENNGRIDSTATSAGITTRQLHKLMKKHGLRKEEFKPSILKPNK